MMRTALALGIDGIIAFGALVIAGCVLCGALGCDGGRLSTAESKYRAGLASGTAASCELARVGGVPCVLCGNAFHHVAISCDWSRADGGHR